VDNALKMPGGISEDTLNIRHPVSAIVAFAWEKPWYFINLAFHKLFYLYSHIRPYFSGFHNLLSLLYLAPAYLFAIYGLAVTRDVQRPVRMLLICTFCALSAISALTFIDWDGRFLIPVLYIVFLFAANGLWRAWDRLL
jgi:hypothetical protein